MKIGDVLAAMTAYNAGDARRVNHLIKVYGFAKTIGEREGLDADTQEILEIAALTHAIRTVRGKLFRTKTGLELLDLLYFTK